MPQCNRRRALVANATSGIDSRDKKQPSSAGHPRGDGLRQAVVPNNSSALSPTAISKAASKSQGSLRAFP